MLAQSCLAFEISCETILKGGLTVIIGFVLFVGSVLLVLAAVFGRRMGYLVLAVGFFGWMIILSALWTFGFYSQGPETPVNLGPRARSPPGSSSPWAATPRRSTRRSARIRAARLAPGGTNDNDEASVQSVTSATQGYLAAQANADAGRHPRPGRSRPRTSPSRTSSSTRPTTTSRSRGRRRSSPTVGRSSPCTSGTTREREPLLVDVPDRLEPALRGPSPVPGPRRGSARRS